MASKFEVTILANAIHLVSPPPRSMVSTLHLYSPTQPHKPSPQSPRSSESSNKVPGNRRHPMRIYHYEYECSPIM
ncbi:unnamed protein product [Diplocarpon coronariae]